MFDLNLNWKTIAALVGGVVVLLYFIKAQGKEVALGAYDAAKAVGSVAVEDAVGVITSAPEPINVTSSENIANLAFEKLWTKVTGIEESPGAWLYDVLH